MVVKISKGTKLLLLGLCLVVIDQVIKVLVKTNMTIGENFNVIGEWFKIYFIENEGMAFGMKFGGLVGKLILSLFRIVLFGALVWWIRSLLRKGSSGAGPVSSASGPGSVSVSVSGCGSSASGSESSGSVSASVKSASGSSGSRAGSAAPGSKTSGSARSSASRVGTSGLPEPMVPAGVVVGLTLIAAGALGNIIDCLFYGILFSESTYFTVAEFLPAGGGYAPFFFGKVVDMFYFPIIDTTFPDWMPWIGGNPFRFFAPVFNFADSCVTCGALYLLFFQWKYFSKEV